MKNYQLTFINTIFILKNYQKIINYIIINLETMDFYY